MTEEHIFCDVVELQEFFFLNFSSQWFYSRLIAQQRTVRTVNSQFVKAFFCTRIPMQCEWHCNNPARTLACQLERVV
jgi:hypothetical protein